MLTQPRSDALLERIEKCVMVMVETGVKRLSHPDGLRHTPIEYDRDDR
jgi:hypothetical protein